MPAGWQLVGDALAGVDPRLRDNIVSFGIVTADGRYRICSASEKPNLYWACRGGGGGNFGIVTHFVFRSQTHTIAR